MTQLRRILLLAFCLNVVGCTSVVPVLNHSTLPTSWRGMTLYDLEGQLVYAESVSAADDVAIAMREISGQFEELSG